MSSSSRSTLSTPSALVQYVEQQRNRLMSAFAPGTTTLRVGEIIGSSDLFIPPSWRLLSSSTPDLPLIDYLVDALLQSRCIFLLGEAGQGKTTVLKRLFLLLAGRFLTDSSSPL